MSFSDTTPPLITCPDDMSKGFDAGSTSGIVTFTGESATDDSGITPIIDCTPASGDTFIVGANQVTCIATDASSNSESCTFAITITGMYLTLT